MDNKLMIEYVADLMATAMLEELTGVLAGRALDPDGQPITEERDKVFYLCGVARLSERVYRMVTGEEPPSGAC